MATETDAGDAMVHRDSHSEMVVADNSVPPLKIEPTGSRWSDRDSTGPGSLTKEEAKRSDTPVRRSGTPR